MGRTIVKIIKFFIYILIVFFFIYKIIIFFKIDSCLDAGGAWDYPKNICNNVENSSTEEIQCLSNMGTYDRATKQCSFPRSISPDME